MSTPPPGTVVLVGSLNVDLTARTERFPQPGETVTGSELITAPGGKSSNQAAAAAILGSRVRLVGAVGNDAFGTLLLDAAQVAGVDVVGVHRLSDHSTGSAMIVVNSEGENTIIVSPGANGAVEPEMITAESLADVAVLCLCLEVSVQTVLAAAHLGHDAGAEVLLNLSPFREVPVELLTLTDVLLVNKTEAAQLLGDDSFAEDWQAAAVKFAELGLDRVIVTLGANGSVVLDATTENTDNVSTIDGIRVDVVDTTGCGDAFTGAVAHRLAAGDSLLDAARFAGRVSAMSATRAGAQSSYSVFAELASVVN